MSTHNDDLIGELRDARKKERAALASVNDAKVAYRERVSEWKAAGKLVDEILAEIETGSSGRPILDLAMPRNGSANGHANGNGHAGRAKPGECVPGPKAIDFDREIAKAVEKAEALKALRKDWRTVTVEELMAPIGPAGGDIAETLRKGFEIETVDDLAESIRDSLLEWAGIPDAEANGIREALRIFREGRGWDDRTQYPDGIPASWIAEDDDQAEAVEAKPDGGAAPASDLAAAQEVFVPKPAGGWNGERLYFAAEQALGLKPAMEKLDRLVICRKCEGLSRAHGRPKRCVKVTCGSTDVVAYPDFARELPGIGLPKPPAAESICGLLHGGKPRAEDDDIDALLVHACRKYSSALGKWFADHDTASDEELYIEMRKAWPHSRVFMGPDRTGRKHGYTLASHGHELRFWVGVFRGPGHAPDLAGNALLDRVRAVMGLLRPESADSDRSGMDLVTSRPGSSPAANGSAVPEKPQPPAKGGKKGRKAAGMAS